MARLRSQISISLDGFVAGPNQSEEHPLGEGGEQLHDWVVKLEEWREPHGHEGGETNASSAVVRESLDNIGATIMGRKMFGGGPGPWGDDPWSGWWGDDPPFHHPVFVLTHHQRSPLEMEGGTSFTFVTDGIVSALEQAKAAAGRQGRLARRRCRRHPAVPGRGPGRRAASSTSYRSCSATVSGSSRASGRLTSAWSRSKR